MSVRSRIAQLRDNLFRGDVLTRNIKLNTYHGVASTLATNMVGPFVGIFAVKLGASNYQVGLLSSAPAIMSLLAMIPGAKYTESRSEKKTITSRFMLAHRLFYLFLACIPFFVSDRRAILLVCTMALMNLPGSIANVAWQGFISRVVPPDKRAQAFATRNRLMNIIGTCAVLVAGRVLDIISYPLGYQLVFVLAFLFAMLEIWIFNQLIELPTETSTVVKEQPLAQFLRELPGSIWDDIKEILREHRFLRFALTSMFFHFAWQVSWPLFTLYQVKELGATNLWVSILNLSNTGGSLLGYGYWVKHMEKNGSLKTLFVSTSGIFIVPFVYAFSRSLYTIAFFNILTGVIFSGVLLSLFNALLDMTPESRKTTYIGYYNTAINISAIFAPMAGVALLNAFNYRWAFLLSAALRIAGGLAFGAIYYFEQSKGPRPQMPSQNAVKE